MNRMTTSMLAAAVTLGCITSATSAIARQRPDYRGPSQHTSTTMPPIVCIRAPCNPGGAYPRPHVPPIVCIRAPCNPGGGYPRPHVSNNWPYPRPHVPNAWPYPRPSWPVGCRVC